MHRFLHMLADLGRKRVAKVRCERILSRQCLASTNECEITTHKPTQAQQTTNSYRLFIHQREHALVPILRKLDTLFAATRYREYVVSR